MHPLCYKRVDYTRYLAAFLRRIITPIKLLLTVLGHPLYHQHDLFVLSCRTATVVSIFVPKKDASLLFRPFVINPYQRVIGPFRLLSTMWYPHQHLSPSESRILCDLIQHLFELYGAHLFISGSTNPNTLLNLSDRSVATKDVIADLVRSFPFFHRFALISP